MPLNVCNYYANSLLTHVMSKRTLLAEIQLNSLDQGYASNTVALRFMCDQ